MMSKLIRMRKDPHRASSSLLDALLGGFVEVVVFKAATSVGKVHVRHVRTAVGCQD